MAKPALHGAAPAKLNLDLYITGFDSDGPHRGYHRIDSLIVFLDLADGLEAAPADTLSLTTTGPFAVALTDEPDNLVLRAARSLAAVAGIDAGARLTLTKRIPVAAGLGGGSADAAAALRLLSRLWGIELPAAERDALALSLGADVPVCLHGRPAIVSGIGEVITPVPALPAGLSVVLVNPRKALSTAAVFAARQGTFSRPPAERDGIAGHNDLQPAALELMPEAGPMLDALAALPGALAARLTGSGPTGFALFADSAAAADGAARLAAAQPDWWVHAAAVAAESGSG